MSVAGTNDLPLIPTTTTTIDTSLPQGAVGSKGSTGDKGLTGDKGPTGDIKVQLEIKAQLVILV